MNPKAFLLRAMLGAVCGIAAWNVSAQETRELTYATFYGSNDFYETSATYFMEEVTRRTDGRITFKPYYGGSLLQTAEMSTGLAKGAADIAAAVPAAFNPREFPLSGVVLPFITQNPPAATAAFSELYRENSALQDEYKRNNQHLLWAIGSGENTVWTNKPIHTADDLEGARIRAITGVADALKALGGTPISIPWVEALELVQRGGAEGVSGTPFNQSIVTKVFDMAPYGSNGGRMGVYTLVTWAVNANTWESLDEDTQKIIMEVAESVPDHYFEKYNDEIDRAVDLAKEADVQFIPMDEEEEAEWKSVAQPVVFKKWVDMVGSDEAEPLLERYQELVKEFEKKHSYTPGFDRLAELDK